MNREDSKKYLQMLGQELQKKQLTCEILVADGVVILLDVRKPEEPDIDAYMAHLRGDNPAFERQKNISVYFKESGLAIREAAMNIANQEHLAASWLNDAIKAIFFTSPFHEEWIEYPGKRAWLLASTPAPFKMRNIYGGDRMFNHVPNRNWHLDHTI